MAAFRTLWMALVGLYEETVVLVAGNVVALLLNLPIGLALFLIGLASPWFGEDGASQWLLVILGWALLFLPTPGNVALGGLTREAAGLDAPRFGVFRHTLQTRWQLALRCLAVSVIVLGALVANMLFYASLDTWLRFASIVWLYGTLFWLSLHIYVVPLMVHVAEPRVLDLYRRAAFVSLGHPGFTMLLLLLLLAIGLVSVVFLPAYVLIGGAFISVAQAHALREIRRRHGDLVVEPDEQVSRL